MKAFSNLKHSLRDKLDDTPTHEIIALAIITGAWIIVGCIAAFWIARLPNNYKGIASVATIAVILAVAFFTLRPQHEQFTKVIKEPRGKSSRPFQASAGHATTILPSVPTAPVHQTLFEAEQTRAINIVARLELGRTQPVPCQRPKRFRRGRVIPNTERYIEEDELGNKILVIDSYSSKRSRGFRRTWTVETHRLLLEDSPDVSVKLATRLPFTPASNETIVHVLTLRHIYYLFRKWFLIFIVVTGAAYGFFRVQKEGSEMTFDETDFFYAAGICLAGGIIWLLVLSRKKPKYYVFKCAGVVSITSGVMYGFMKFGEDGLNALDMYYASSVCLIAVVFWLYLTRMKWFDTFILATNARLMLIYRPPTIFDRGTTENIHLDQLKGGLNSKSQSIIGDALKYGQIVSDSEADTANSETGRSVDQWVNEELTYLPQYERKTKKLEELVFNARKLSLGYNRDIL